MFSMVRSVRCVGQFGIHQSRSFFATVMWLVGMGATQAQTDRSLGGWHLSAGWQDYSEAQMQLKGPELGLHWQSRSWGPYRLEAEAHLGLQNYTSAESGRLYRVPNIDTRWRAFRVSSTQLPWQYGLALHTHANFLRGTTSLGFGGYDRLSTQLWLPIRWQSVGDQRWAVDAGWLLWGEQVSRLSQVSTRLHDVSNQQRKGAYVQINQKLTTSRGELEPYVRWTWVDDSNVQLMLAAGQRAVSYEPENTRLQVGVKWRFR